jgi:hypothetical protein
MFENMVLRRMFLIVWKEITGELGRMRRSELQCDHALCVCEVRITTNFYYQSLKITDYLGEVHDEVDVKKVVKIWTGHDWPRIEFGNMSFEN